MVYHALTKRAATNPDGQICSLLQFGSDVVDEHWRV